MSNYPRTPDERYLVVNGRLWRASNPSLPEATRQLWVNKLMDARRAVKVAGSDQQNLKTARALVEEAKCELGERGPVWWTDGTPDYNRYLAKNTPYADWYERASIAE